MALCVQDYACTMVVSHLLVLPEVCLDGDGEGLVLQFAGVQELLQELSLPPPLLCQGGHLWGTLHCQLGMQSWGEEDVSTVYTLRGVLHWSCTRFTSQIQSIHLEGNEGDEGGEAS